MQKFFSAVAFLAILLCATFSYAATYGPADAKFTIKPAPGWTEAAMEGGVQLTNGKSALVIVIAPHGGLTLEAFGAAVIEQAGLTDAQKEADGDTFMIKGKKTGTDITIILTKLDDGKNLASFTMSGTDTDDMKAMIDSMDDAK